MKIITRKVAKIKQLKRYFTGKVCRHGHVSERYTCDGGCVECNKITYTQWRKDNPKKYKQQKHKSYIRNRIKNITYAKQYQKVHPPDPEKIKVANKEWRRVNKEKIKKKKQADYVKDPERFKKRAQASYAKNPEKAKARIKEWQSKNPEKVKVYGQKRRANKRGANYIPYSHQEKLTRFALFNNECAYCGSSNKITDDHVIAISKFGPHQLDNLVPACFSCNVRKNANPVYIWYSKQPFFSKRRWNKIVKHCPLLSGE